MNISETSRSLRHWKSYYQKKSLEIAESRQKQNNYLLSLYSIIAFRMFGRISYSPDFDASLPGLPVTTLVDREVRPDGSSVAGSLVDLASLRIIIFRSGQGKYVCVLRPEGYHHIPDSRLLPDRLVARDMFDPFSLSASGSLFSTSFTDGLGTFPEVSLHTPLLPPVIKWLTSSSSCLIYVNRIQKQYLQNFRIRVYLR